MEQLYYQLSEWFYLAGYDVLLVAFCIGIIIFIRSRKQNELSQLIQDSPLAMLVVSEQTGQLLASNRAAMQLLGIRVVGKRFVYPSTVPSDSIFALVSQFGGSSFNKHQFSWTVSDLHAIDINLSGRKGNFKGQRAWTLYAVPYEKTVEETVKEQASLKMAKMAMDSLSELIFIKDNDDLLIGTNKAFDNFWKERREEGNLSIKGRMQGRSNQRRWTTDPEGRSCLLETSQTMLLSESGEIMGTLGISHDVTDWYKMQQDLRNEMDKRKGTEAALAQRDIILQSLLDSSPDAVGIFDENKVYQACNQAFATALGIDDYHELIGHRVEELLPAEVHERFSRSDDLVINEGKTLRYVDHMFDDTGETWLDVVKSPYRDTASETSGVLVMARDVTERYLAERKLEDMNEELEKLSFLDSLTTIANRRQFDEKLMTFWNLHIRQKAAMTVLLVDIDFFKHYNDNYGHQQGDQALVEVAKTFTKVLTRSTDCVARYGGEEFAFILPETDENGAAVIAESIHEAIAELDIHHEFSVISSSLTLSIGVATHTPQFGETPNSIVSWADEALYEAKKQGRNRTCFYAPEDVSHQVNTL
ncbi:diguanylate cyclase [Vibrio sp. JC009]|uniref:sensor domain-containing diguanylate cyclase n=1 Tax=Vibrio sp. JC009 TaxID=2912314 RepID=UPI0023B1F2A0|nr:diguanylate cyclase [Vibrio sp. JC009]WED22333.1 diguanylate cyclase [Vibrio sp. JC009]